MNLKEKSAGFNSHWEPKIAGELDGQQVKLAKFQDEFIRYAHEDEDELFLVVSGSFEMLYRDRSVTVSPRTVTDPENK